MFHALNPLHQAKTNKRCEIAKWEGKYKVNIKGESKCFNVMKTTWRSCTILTRKEATFTKWNNKYFMSFKDVKLDLCEIIPNNTGLKCYQACS